MTRSGDGIWIDTGAARFHVEPGPHVPFSDVTIGDLPVLIRSLSGLVVEDENRVRCATEVNSVSLEVAGPRRACVLIRAQSGVTATSSWRWNCGRTSLPDCLRCDCS